MARQAACADAERNKMANAYAGLRQEARDRQVAGRGNDGSGGRGKKKQNPVEQIPQGFDDRKTRSARAKIAETNAKYINIADKLLEEHPVKFQEVKRGELLAEAPKNEGTRGTAKGRNSSGGIALQPPESTKPTLKSLGITKDQSSKWQKLAKLPEEKFGESLQA